MDVLPGELLAEAQWLEHAQKLDAFSALCTVVVCS